MGYDVDRSGPSPKLVINAEEAAQVRRIFTLYLELGSLLPVVEELQQRDWKGKTWRTKAGLVRGGRQFDKNTLHYLLTNPMYLGKIKHKTEVFDGEHEPIVDAGVFEQVQTTLREHGRAGGSHLVNKYGATLKGLVYCKNCGRVMVHTYASRGPKRWRYYTCSKAIKEGWAKCPLKSLPAAEVENLVLEEIRRIAHDGEFREEVLRQACVSADAELAELGIQRQQLERQLARDHAEIRRLVEVPDPNSVTSARMADIHERITRDERQLVQNRSRVAEIEHGRITPADVAAAFADFDNVWNELTTRERAHVMRLLVARVEFDPSDSTIAISFHPSAIKSLANAHTEEAA